MQNTPYPYPKHTFGNWTDPTNEHFPRRDAALASDDLEKLLVQDPDRWLVEWTYRVFDYEHNLGDVGDFLEELMLKWLAASKIPATSHDNPRGGLTPSKVGLVECAVGLYRGGDRSLSITCQAIRRGVGGYTSENIRGRS